MRAYSHSRISLAAVIILSAVLIAAADTALGQKTQLVSSADPAHVVAGGGGDSLQPLLSANGRFVAFASTARNLVPGGTSDATASGVLNVFRRDLTTGTTVLVSIGATAGAPANGDSVPVAISADGQFVLFESIASNLVAADTNAASDVFLRDVSARTTKLVSVGPDGVPAAGNSRGAVTTPDGRYVAFVSEAPSLTAGDTNGIPDIFVRDLQQSTTVLASAGASGTGTASDSPFISDDGRYVVFRSTATNMVPGVPPGGDIYARDLLNSTTTWVSAYGRSGAGTNAATCLNHVLSANGRFIAYEVGEGYAPGSCKLYRYDLVSGETTLVHTNAWADRQGSEPVSSVDISSDGRAVVFLANTPETSATDTCVQLWDAESGTVTLLSGDPAGQVPPGTTCAWVVFDQTGRYVAFLSTAQLTTNPLRGEYFLYLKDRQTGDLRVINADADGICALVLPSSVPGYDPGMGKIAFEARDGLPAEGEGNHCWDIFVYDVAGATTGLASARDTSLPSRSANDISTFQTARISADGRYAVFTSAADNLSAKDTNGYPDVFLWDICTGGRTLVSSATNGFSGTGVSCEADISSDGLFVAFSSTAANLAAADSNNYVQDVFLRDLQNNRTDLVSVHPTGLGSGNAASGAPIVSKNGRYVLFRSKASNLTAGISVNTNENLFLRDMELRTTWALTTGGVLPARASMTPDGAYIAYGASYVPGATHGYFYVWNTAAAKRIYTNSATTSLVDACAITPDGSYVFYSGGSALMGVDLGAGTNWIVAMSSGVWWDWPSLRVSSNGFWLAAVKTLGTTPKYSRQVWLYDLKHGSATLVSKSWDSGLPITGYSDHVEMSGDGRFLVFRSTEASIVPGDNNDQPDVFLYDRDTGRTDLLSATQDETGANRASGSPSISADASTVLFNSWDGSLVSGDYNSVGDLFAATVFRACLMPGAEGLTLSWPWSPDTTYKVLYQEFVSPDWHESSGTLQTNRNKMLFRDTMPAAASRFYRVIAY